MVKLSVLYHLPSWTAVRLSRLSTTQGRTTTGVVSGVCTYQGKKFDSMHGGSFFFVPFVCWLSSVVCCCHSDTSIVSPSSHPFRYPIPTPIASFIHPNSSLSSHTLLSSVVVYHRTNGYNGAASLVPGTLGITTGRSRNVSPEPWYSQRPGTRKWIKVKRKMKENCRRSACCAVVVVVVSTESTVHTSKFLVLVGVWYLE